MAASDKPEDFGHEPLWLGGQRVCRRCLIRRFRVWVTLVGPRRHDYADRVPWPCTSAVVLGLITREVAR